MKASTKDGRPQEHGKIADFFMKRDNKEYYIEIKTVKPNIDVFYYRKFVASLAKYKDKSKVIEAIKEFEKTPEYSDLLKESKNRFKELSKEDIKEN